MKKTLILTITIIALSLFTYSTIKWCLWDNDQSTYTEDVYTDLSKDEMVKWQKALPTYKFDLDKKYTRVDKITYSRVKTKFLCYKDEEISKQCIHIAIELNK